jgi:hypothetical protein
MAAVVSPLVATSFLDGAAPARPRPSAIHARPPRSHRAVVGAHSHRAAVYRRRRFVAAAVGLGIVAVLTQAGAALGGTSKIAGLDGGAGGRPQVVTVTVEPGDSLWSIAERLAPDADPRAVVDALVEARGTTVVVPGETLTWLDA